MLFIYFFVFAVPIFFWYLLSDRPELGSGQVTGVGETDIVSLLHRECSQFLLQGNWSVLCILGHVRVTKTVVTCSSGCFINATFVLK